jgi:hypothetical protein
MHLASCARLLDLGRPRGILTNPVWSRGSLIRPLTDSSVLRISSRPNGSVHRLTRPQFRIALLLPFPFRLSDRFGCWDDNHLDAVFLCKRLQNSVAFHAQCDGPDARRPERFHQPS